MNGYKTGGDWTDITSIGRNEVVFEGRHKAYGAFYIRQHYPNTLLFALLSAIGFIATCALIAYTFRGVSHLPVTPKTDVAIKPTDVLIHTQVINLPVTHPHALPPKGPAPKSAPPVITKQPDSIRIPDVKPDNHTIIAQLGNPGTGNNTSGINSSPTSGNPLPPPPDNKPLTWVNQMPEFPNGNIADYLANQLRYPPEEAQSGIEGTVYASFIIEKDGSVSNVAVVRGISNGPDLNKEAIRVLSEMPKWIPGKQNGYPVRVQYLVPIRFKLQ